MLISGRGCRDGEIELIQFYWKRYYHRHDYDSKFKHLYSDASWWIFLFLLFSFISVPWGEEMVFVQREPLVPSLFPSFEVTTESDVPNMAGAMAALADEGSGRIADVKLLRIAARSKLLYLLAYLNKQDIQSTAQVLPRQRDGKMRLRVIFDYPVTEDDEPEVFRVGASTNGTALAAAMSYRLRAVTSMQGSSRANTVRLELFGNKASDVAMYAVERTQCITSREISLVVHFEGEDEDRPVLVASISATWRGDLQVQRDLRFRKPKVENKAWWWHKKMQEIGKVEKSVFEFLNSKRYEETISLGWTWWILPDFDSSWDLGFLSELWFKTASGCAVRARWRDIKCEETSWLGRIRARGTFLKMLGTDNEKKIGVVRMCFRHFDGQRNSKAQSYQSGIVFEVRIYDL